MPRATVCHKVRCRVKNVFNTLLKNRAQKVPEKYFWSNFERLLRIDAKSIVKDIKQHKIGKPGQNYQGEH